MKKLLIVALSLGAVISANAQQVGKTYYIQCVANGKNLYASGANNGDPVQLMTPNAKDLNQQFTIVQAVTNPNARVIVCKGNTRALDAPAQKDINKDKNNVAIQMWESHGDFENQYWTIEKLPNGNYHIVGAMNKKALYGPNAGSPADAEGIATRTRIPIPEKTVEQWKFIEVK